MQITILIRDNQILQRLELVKFSTIGQVLSRWVKSYNDWSSRPHNKSILRIFIVRVHKHLAQKSLFLKKSRC